jgi:hypothetical protein
LTEAERDELQRVTMRGTVNRLLAFRARLMLACAEPLSSTGVAERHRSNHSLREGLASATPQAQRVR